MVKTLLLLSCLFLINVALSAGILAKYEATWTVSALQGQLLPAPRVAGDDMDLPVNPSNTSHQLTGPELVTLITAPVVGGLGLSVLAVFSFLSEIKNPLTQSLMLLIPAGCGALSNYLFTKVLIDRKYHWDKSLLYGLVAGAIVGMAAGILCMLPLMLIGEATGEIVMNEPISTLELIGAASLVGGGMGCVLGAGLGLLEAPVISLILKY